MVAHSRGRPLWSPARRGSRQRSERMPSYPADVFPPRRAGEATTLAKRKELSDDGRQSFERRPKGRWSGDIGGGGNPINHSQPIFRTRQPKRDAAMIRPTKHPPTHANGRNITVHHSNHIKHNSDSCHPPRQPLKREHLPSPSQSVSGTRSGANAGDAHGGAGPTPNPASTFRGRFQTCPGTGGGNQTTITPTWSGCWM